MADAISTFPIRNNTKLPLITESFLLGISVFKYLDPSRRQSGGGVGAVGVEPPGCDWGEGRRGTGGPVGHAGSI